VADDRKRLDESLSIDALRKSLTGNANTRPALSRIQISQTGQVQPKDSETAPASQQGSTGGSGGGGNNSSGGGNG
jgi:hypothetical protein